MCYRQDEITRRYKTILHGSCRKVDFSSASFDSSKLSVQKIRMQRPRVIISMLQRVVYNHS